MISRTWPKRVIAIKMSNAIIFVADHKIIHRVASFYNLTAALGGNSDLGRPNLSLSCSLQIENKNILIAMTGEQLYF